MAVLSKPYEIVFQLLGSYFNQLYQHPIRTKSITSCLVAVLGSYTSQCLLGARRISQDSLIAFGLFGLLFGGRLPHYFYQLLTRFISEESKYGNLQRLVAERLIFTPLYQFFSLYTLSRFEGKTHEQSLKHTLSLYAPLLAANWKYLTLAQFINVTFVPPVLRVLFANLIGFFWVIYLAKRRSSSKKTSTSTST